MRVQAKGKIKDRHEDRNYILEDGDQVSVPDVLGALWAKNGWAINLDTGEDNAPVKNPVTLDVQNASHKMGVKNG